MEHFPISCEFVTILESLNAYIWSCFFCQEDSIYYMTDSRFNNIPFLILIILFISIFNSFSQFEEDYTPRKSYSSKSKILIKSLEMQLKDAQKSLGTKSEPKLNRIYKKKTQSLIQWVKHEIFIDDDTLNLFLNSILETVNQQSRLQHKIKTILVSRDPEVNAYCLGEGTIVINIGLLSRVRNESQLAFVLCHELAHYELGHINKRIENYATGSEHRGAKKNLEALFFSDISLEQASNLKRWANKWGKHARVSEFEADSLGYLLFSKTPYRQQGLFETLNILDSVDYPRHTLGDKLFKNLNFKNYPFNEKWLRNRLSIYRKEPAAFVFNWDSISTHPYIKLRRKKVKEYFITKSSDVRNLHPKDLVNWVIKTAQFETVEGAFKFNRYDLCLHQALQLKFLYPDNRYLTGMIGKVLINLLNTRKNTPSLYKYFVNDYTINYSDELRAVNNFLHNISKEELGEIAFHFLNNKSNFNHSDQYHYYLLWQICDLTSRNELKQKVKESYIQSFPSTNYCKEMNCTSEHYMYHAN